MSGPRCSGCDYTFDDCVCLDMDTEPAIEHETKPEPQPLLLWNEDESWTNEALHMDVRFSQIVRNFIKDYPEYKIRDMEMLMILSVTTTARGLISHKRFVTKTTPAPNPVLIKDDCCGLEDMGEQD